MMRRSVGGGLRHAGDIARVRRAAVESPGVAESSARRKAYDAGPLPAPLGTFLEKVRGAPWAVGDDDFAALRAAGYSEDMILEFVVAAACGAAGRRYDAAMRAMRAEA